MLNSILLTIHIAAGSVALLTAMVALVTQKGGLRHVLAGRVYALAMTVVFLTAVPLAVMGADIFLLLIAVFSFYLVFAGWRFARNYMGKAHVADWSAIAALAISGLGMWVYAVALAFGGDSQWVTMVIFGAIALALGLADALYYRERSGQGTAVPSDRRIARHLTNMMAGTIATITATMVVNIQTNPAWIAWIAPTIAITPLIVWWNFRVREQGNIRRGQG
jgi:hypothetical protein